MSWTTDFIHTCISSFSWSQKQTYENKNAIIIIMKGANALYIELVYGVNCIHPDFLLIRKIYLIYILISRVLKNNNYNIQLRAKCHTYIFMCRDVAWWAHHSADVLDFLGGVIHMTFIISLCV